MNIFIVLTMIAVILSFALMVIVILMRTQDRALYLIFLFSACFMYSFGYLLEITSTQADAAFFGVRVSYIGLPAILPLSYLFLREVYQEKRLSPGWHVLMFIIPFVSLLSVQLYPAVKLYYRDIEYIFNRWIANCRLYPAILNHVGFAYTYFIAILCILLILKHYKKDSKYRRQQSLVLLFALLLPVLTTIPYVASSQALRYDFTPMATSVTMVLLLYSVFFTNFLLLVPLGREQVLEEMSDAFLVCSANDQFLYANGAAKSLFPELYHLKPGDPLTGLAGLDGRQEEVSLQAEGQTRIFKVSYTEIQPDIKKSGYCILYHDITHKAELLSKLQFRSTYDELMGILNRNSFIAMNSGAGEDTSIDSALLMLDVDYFKGVNDTWGHAAGDQVLRDIAAVIQAYLSEDESFGRFGGEELLIMFKNLDKDETFSRAEGLREWINSSSFDFQGHRLFISVSIGIAHSPLGQSIPFDLMLKRADKALYIAKEKGRNRTHLFRDNE